MTMDLTQLTDAQVLGLTGAGEARARFVPGHGWQPAPIEDMVACMCTAINRVAADPHRFGATVSDACFEHAQYSCWNAKSGSNHDWLLSQATAILTGRSIAPIVQQCISAATRLLEAIIPDAVAGATHYYSPVSMVPTGRVPLWARGKTPVATVGDHIFFKGV
jgi:hypothetical protein